MQGSSKPHIQVQFLIDAPFNHMHKSNLISNLRKQRKNTIFNLLKKRNMGNVFCFVCGKKVKFEDATLEHITPLSKGGSDEMSNYSISHKKCNNEKADKIIQVKTKSKAILL